MSVYNRKRILCTTPQCDSMRSCIESDSGMPWHTAGAEDL